MSCACGYEHIITLSDDGTVYSFGRNEEGALGLGHKHDVSLPTHNSKSSKNKYDCLWFIIRSLCG